MKKILFIIISSLCFADNYRILETEKNIIEKKIDKLNIQKELSYSKINILELRKDFILKNIEITEEKIKVTNEYYQGIYRIEELNELRKISQMKLDNLSKIKKNQKDLKKSVSNEEFFEIESSILKEKLQFLLYVKEEDQINLIMKNNSFNLLKNQNISYFDELNSSFLLYIELKEQELNLFSIEKRGEFDISIKNEELRLVKLNYEEKINEFNKYTLELKKNFEKVMGSIEELDLRIKFTEEKLRNLKNFLNQGIISEKDCLSEEIKMLDLKQEKISLEGQDKALKAELSTRIKVNEVKI